MNSMLMKGGRQAILVVENIILSSVLMLYNTEVSPHFPTSLSQPSQFTNYSQRPQIFMIAMEVAHYFRNLRLYSVGMEKDVEM